MKISQIQKSANNENPPSQEFQETFRQTWQTKHANKFVRPNLANKLSKAKISQLQKPAKYKNQPREVLMKPGKTKL